MIEHAESNSGQTGCPPHSAVLLLQARLGPKLQQAQPGPRRAEEQAAPQPVQNRLGGQSGVHRRVDPSPMAHRRQSTSADQVRLDFWKAFACIMHADLQEAHAAGKHVSLLPCWLWQTSCIVCFVHALERSPATLCDPQLRCTVIVAKLMQQYCCCVFGVEHHRQRGITSRWQYP